MGKPIIWSGINAKLINSGDLIDSKNNSLTNGAKINITKIGHGWTSADIGRPLYLNGSVWTLAEADVSATAEISGFIYSIIDADTVRVAMGGQIPNVGANLVEGGGSLVAGEAYFLSGTAGKITTTEPTIIGYVSKPVGIAASTSTLLAYNFRGAVVGGANARTQITLSNNITANILNVSTYEAGEIVGWVFIDATTDYRFLVKTQFAKNGAGTNWNISYQTVGDTPPVGFSISITSGGIIQYTMPSVSGFVSSFLNYALNAPAVGTTFPLSIDGGAVVSGTVSAARLPQVSTSAQGAFPSLTSSLDNQTATQLGLKQYLHGTTYNGGNAPTVTSAQAGFSVTRAVFLPYQTQDGAWRLRLNIATAFTSASLTTTTLSINGITFKNISGYSQPISVTLPGTVTVGRAFANENTSQLRWDLSVATTVTGMNFSGDVELDLKPTWAY